MKEESTLLQNLEKLNDQVDKAIETINGQKKLLAEYEKENAELKSQIEKMKKVMTDVFEDMEADMCSTENEILFDYLKRFLKKYEVIV